jgi:hypothetical protein
LPNWKNAPPLSGDVFRQAISANNLSPYPLHHLSVSARNMRPETISLPKSETTSTEAAMSRLLFEREELFRFRAQMEAAIALRRAANHKWYVARDLLHVVFERLDVLERKASNLRSAFQENDASRLPP